MTIEIEQSNVESQTLDLEFEEEIIIDESMIVYNKDQVKSLITNLTDNSKKMKIYFDLYKQHEMSLMPTVKTVFPILLSKSFDLEKDEDLSEYLSRFHSFNRNNSLPYHVASKKLYNVQKPFALHTETGENNKHHANTTITKNTDAYSWNIDTEKPSKFPIRLIGEVNLPIDDKIYTLYEGDEIEQFGYYNLVSNNKNYETFDFKKYKSHVDSLNVGDIVNVLFNDFHFDGEYIDETKGTIEKIEEAQSIEIRLKKDNSIIIYSLKKAYNPVFIYHDSYPNKFLYSKRDIGRTNIVLYGTGLSPEHIHPISISEHLFMNFDLIKNSTCMQDIDDLIFKPYDIDVNDIPLSFSTLLHKFIKRNIPPVPKFVQIKRKAYDFNSDIKLLNLINKYNKDSKNYKGYKTFSDSELARFLFIQKKKDFGYSFFMNALFDYVSTKKIPSKSTMAKNKKDIEDRLDVLKKNIKRGYGKITSVAKKYKNIEDLNKDNESTAIYFDEDLDKTKYSLINKLPKGATSDKAKLIAIMNELPQDMNIVEKEFEANSILQKKRKVRVGDFAILNDHETCPMSTLYYQRKNVEGKKMWIKTQNNPTDAIQEHDSCLLGSFEALCDDVESNKVIREYNNLTNQYTLIENMLKANPKNIQRQIRIFKQYLKLPYSRSSAFGDFSYEDVVDYENLDTENEEQYMFNNIDYSVLYDEDKDGNKGKEKIKNSDTLASLIGFTEVDIGDYIQYILQYNNYKHEFDLEQEMKAHVESMAKQRKAFISKYPNQNKLQKAMVEFDILAEKKKEEYAAKIIRENNKKCTITMSSMMILIILATYPKILIKRISPNCVKYLSYTGYPFQNNTERNLIKYFACLIKSVGTPGDLKFSQFSDINLDVIEQMMKDEIKVILEEKHGLREQIELNSTALKNINNNNNNKSSTSKKSKNYEEFTMFRPSFDISSTPNTVNSHAISILKEMHSTVIDKKVLKTNIFKVPYLQNACCMEILNDQFNYVNYFKFTKSSQGKRGQQANHENMNKEKIHTKTLYPPVAEKVTFKDSYLQTENIKADEKPSTMLKMQEKESISFNDRLNKYKKNNPNDDIVQGIDFYNNTWWEMIYPKLTKMFNELNPRMSKEDKEFLSNTIISPLQVVSFKNIERTLLNFIKVQVPLNLNRVVQRYVPKKLSDEDALKNIFVILINDNANDTVSNSLLKSVKMYSQDVECLHFNILDESTDLKNTTLLSYVAIKIMHMVSVKCDNRLVEYLIKLLVFDIKHNDNNLSSIKNVLAELREKSKVEKIGKYAQSAEARRIQNENRALGFQDWEVTGIDDTIILDEDFEERGENGEDEVDALHESTTNNDDVDGYDMESDNDSDNET